MAACVCSCACVWAMPGCPAFTRAASALPLLPACSRRGHHLLPVRPTPHDQVCLPAGEAPPAAGIPAGCPPAAAARAAAGRLGNPRSMLSTAVVFESSCLPACPPAEPGEAWLQAGAVHPVLRQPCCGLPTPTAAASAPMRRQLPSFTALNVLLLRPISLSQLSASH